MKPSVHLSTSAARFARTCLRFALLLPFLPVLAVAATLTGRVRDTNTSSYLLGANISIRELGRSANTASDGSGGFLGFSMLSCWE